MDKNASEAEAATRMQHIKIFYGLTKMLCKEKPHEQNFDTKPKWKDQQSHSKNCQTENHKRSIQW